MMGYIKLYHPHPQPPPPLWGHSWEAEESTHYLVTKVILMQPRGCALRSILVTNQ